MARKAGRGPAVHLTPAQARRIYAYNFRVFDRFVRRVKRLPWRAVRRRRGVGHESIFDTLVHILNVQEVWLAYIAQGAQEADLERLFQDRSRHPSNWREFAAYHRRVRTSLERYLGRLTPRELAKPIRVFWMPGEYDVSEGILQTTFETAHHLGEIIGVLWQDDLPPPEMTWIMVGRAR